MSSPFPDEVEYDMNFAETGRSGCLIPQIEDDSIDSTGGEDEED